MDVCVPHLCLVLRGQKQVLDALELELWVVSCHVGARN